MSSFMNVQNKIELKIRIIIVYLEYISRWQERCTQTYIQSKSLFKNK